MLANKKREDGTNGNNRRYGSFLALSFSVCSVFFLSTSPAADSKSAKTEEARELIKKARIALGGEEALGKVQTLSVSAKLRRFIKYVSVQSPKRVVEKEKTLSGKLEIDFMLPDRFRKRVSSQTLRGFGYTYTEIVNGNRAWRNPPLRAISSGRDSRVIDVDDFERTVEMQRQGARQQLTVYSLGLMLQALPSFPLELSYAGQFQTQSGDAKVIIAEGLEEFQFFLLLDPKSNIPISLATVYVGARQQMVMVESAGFFDRKHMMETVQRARQERQQRAKPPQRFEMHIQLSDYRQVAGVLWPHRILTKLNGEVTEEFVLDEFEINRPINPKKFEGEPRPEP